VKTLRVIGRLILLGDVVLRAMADFFIRCAFRKKNPRLLRASWMQRHSRRALNIFKLQPQVTGIAPSRGLLISNHLSYLDIMVIASVTPAIFVAKREVKFWPVFGLCAQMGGTLFVDRARRTQVGEVNFEIQTALDDGALVVLFPEGTSSNGQTVLPFKSALLEPVVGQAHPLAISCIQYALDNGDAGEEICYWGDDTFFTHLVNLMSKQNVRAAVSFAPFNPTGADRKELARELREEILKLKTGPNRI
jgi:1-acyl-sn-glycerol-3-phosphate acyltransferase